MVELFLLENYDELKNPRREMKYFMVCVSVGQVSITIDENDFILKAGEIITITSGQIHYVKNIASARGYILSFTLDFFCNDDNDIELIFHNGLFCHFSMNEVIQVKNFDVIESQLLLIKDEIQDQPYQYLISTHSRIEIILVEINRAKVERGDEIWRPDALFLRFLEAVRANFENNFTLADYAKMLGTTEPKLNELAKLHAGKTAQNVIYGLIVSEAKRNLTYERLTIKEIAFKLGFNDPFYFSNFFKKHAKVSPKSYQRSHALYKMSLV
jgi:AraC-like DNA-binding protein